MIEKINIIPEIKYDIECSECHEINKFKISELMRDKVECLSCHESIKLKKEITLQANINRVFHVYFTNDFILSLDNIKSSTNIYRSRYIFRGIPSWGKLESSAKFRLRKDHEKKGLNPYRQIDFINYHQNLIEQGRKNITNFASPDLTDIEILAEIQHYGGATCLIDFSYNYLIALYFASAPYKRNNGRETHGKIFVVDLYDPRNEKIYLLNKKYMNKNIEEILMKKDDYDGFQQPRMWMWQPNKLNNRIIRQDSVFLFCMDQIKKNINLNYRSILIAPDDKLYIRTILSSYFNITAETIFEDLQGYSSISNGRGTEINKDMLKHGTCLTYGRELYRKEDYISAENILDNSINCLKNGKNKCENECDHENLVDIYLFKARTMEKLKNFYGALNYYDKCIDILNNTYGKFTTIKQNSRNEDEYKTRFYKQRKRTIYLEKLNVYYTIQNYEEAFKCCRKIVEEKEYYVDIKFLLSITELSIIISSKREYEKYMKIIYDFIKNEDIIDAIPKYELFKSLGTVIFGSNFDIKELIVEEIKDEKYIPLVEWNYDDLYHHFKHRFKSDVTIRDQILKKIRDTEDYDQFLYKRYYLSRAEF